MLYALAAMLLCQLAGEAFVRALAVPVLGPVVGMILLASLLMLKAPLPSGLGGTADGVLKNLSLLFVPAGVGVVQQLDRLGGEAVRLIVVIVLSTGITLAVTALVFAGVARFMADGAAIRTAGGEAPVIHLVDLWVYLSHGPLLWLTATLIAYLIADAISARLRRHPLANPVLIAIALLSLVLLASGTPFAAYFAGAQFVHFLLGPATVALAVPLVRHLPQVRRLLVPILAALLVGSLTAIVSAVMLARAFGLDGATIRALAPKSVTAAIAMGTAQQIGADPALTAVLVILTGISGAILVTPVMPLIAGEERRRHRLRRRACLARHRHRSGIPDRSACRHLCRYCAPPQRPRYRATRS